MNRIPVEECIDRRIYKIRCRNLTVGVWNAKVKGFTGIREKFGHRFLFTEYHYDNGPPFGTVSEHEDTGIDLPEDISCSETLGTFDETTSRRITWNKEVPNPNGAQYGGGWWMYEDTGETCPPTSRSGGTRACSISNRALFSFLDTLGDDPKED